jgi:N-acetylneuraminic acid mutarotase
VRSYHAAMTRRRHLPIVLMSMALGCSEHAQAPLGPTETPPRIEAAATAATWQVRADYPTNIYEAVSAAYTNPTTLASTLYVIGGATQCCARPGTFRDAVWAYNVSANTWSRKASIPVVLARANMAVQLNGKIYVSGGFTRFRDPTRDIWRLDTSKALYTYDIAKNTWTRKADLPGPFTDGVAAAYNGFIYVATACVLQLCGNSQRGTLWRYNPSTDRWTQESRIPNGNTYLPQGGIIGGKFYVIDGDSQATDIYNLSTKVWTAGPPRPTLRCIATSTTFQAKVYVANCLGADGASGMFVLDPQANTWTQLPAAPKGVFATLARVGVNGLNRLELIGGAKDGSNWQYTP